MTKTDYFAWMDELLKKKKNPRVRLFLARYHSIMKSRHDNAHATYKELTELINSEFLADYPRWKVFLRHFQLQNLINNMGHVKRALPYGIENLIMLEDPVFDDFPQRHCVINDLLSCYYIMDPIGYFEILNQKIHEGLATIPEDMICRSCYLMDRLMMYRFRGNLVELNDHVQEILIAYSSKSEEYVDDSKYRLYLNVCDVYLDRGVPEKASSFFDQVCYEKLLHSYSKMHYHLIDGLLTLRASRGTPPKSILYKAADVVKTSSLLGFDILTWQGFKLAGEYCRRAGQHYRAVDFYVRALDVLSEMGTYRDEVETALTAATLARKIGHPGFGYCLGQAEAANSQLKSGLVSLRLSLS